MLQNLAFACYQSHRCSVRPLVTHFFTRWKVIGIGFRHGDLEEPRITEGVGVEGKYTQLPEPIRDHTKPPVDLKLTEEKNNENPFSKENKNEGSKDFFDVLSDDEYDLRKNISDPYWVKNAGGENELKRVLKKRKALKGQLTTKEVRLMNKRVWYLFKKYNFKTDQAKAPFPE